jgi:hypothetical protein
LTTGKYENTGETADFFRGKQNVESVNTFATGRAFHENNERFTERYQAAPSAHINHFTLFR